MTRDTQAYNDDDIPVLRDVVRPGDQSAIATPESAPSSADMPLTEGEIDAIAHQVAERYSARLRDAMEQGIRNAIRVKQTPDRNPE